jgi:hypothetical protein
MPAGDGYVGRWNVKITDAADTFASGGFQIAKKDGVLSAGVVWRWGSYLPAKSAEVRDGTLVVVWDEEPGKGKLDTFEARLEGDTLKGKVTYADGKVHHFEGKRAPLLLSRKAPVWGAPVTLFDGKTLNGWKLRDPKKKNGWAVVNGELAVVDLKDNADLVSERTFQDLKLHLEFNVEPKSNSGVYLRGQYEIQILDNPDAKMALDAHGCGGVYSRIAPTLDATSRPGSGRPTTSRSWDDRSRWCSTGRRSSRVSSTASRAGRSTPTRASRGRSCCRATTARSASATSS